MNRTTHGDQLQRARETIRRLKGIIIGVSIALVLFALLAFGVSSGTNLREAFLSQPNLRQADLHRAVVTDQQLDQAKSL